MFPTKKQWKLWTLPSKLTAIGTYIGVIGIILSTLFFIIPYFVTKSNILTPHSIHSNINEIIIPQLPEGTGWLLLGTFDYEKGYFIRGPFYKVIQSNYPKKSILPRKGEQIEITVERNLIIADYKTAGISKIFQPPWQENILKDDDYTGIKILKGAKLEVRELSPGHFQGMPSVIWVRIGYIPK